jgi:hypothetical protein
MIMASFEESCTERSGDPDFVTLRRLAEVLSLPGTAVQQLASALRARTLKRCLPPLWAVSATAERLLASASYSADRDSYRMR